MAYKEITGPTGHDFKIEPVIEGMLLATSQGQYGDNYEILRTDGEKVLVFGSAVMRTKMAQVKTGKKVRITDMGMKKNKKGTQEYHDFKVEYE